MPVCCYQVKERIVMYFYKNHSEYSKEDFFLYSFQYSKKLFITHNLLKLKRNIFSKTVFFWSSCKPVFNFFVGTEGSNYTYIYPLGGRGRLIINQINHIGRLRT